MDDLAMLKSGGTVRSMMIAPAGGGPGSAGGVGAAGGVGVAGEGGGR
jgi:hypothetical protein